MYLYDHNALKTVMESVVTKNVSDDALRWLKSNVDSEDLKNLRQFSIAFVAMPRKTGKDPVNVSEEENRLIDSIRPGFTIREWSVDRLCRVWLLMHLAPSGRSAYVSAIENLFLNAEMNEQVALYSALPVLAYSDVWPMRCAEGIRSNIALVLLAIMCDNPYPCEQLDEKAWNQLVLKAIFTDKPLHKIVGLQQRANQDLANTISDFAHERWAAHRTVNPLVWMCVSQFLNDHIFSDIQRLSVSENKNEREAAALVCSESDYTPARKLLNEMHDLKEQIEGENLTWDTLALQVE